MSNRGWFLLFTTVTAFLVALLVWHGRSVLPSSSVQQDTSYILYVCVNSVGKPTNLVSISGSGVAVLGDLSTGENDAATWSKEGDAYTFKLRTSGVVRKAHVVTADGALVMDGFVGRCHHYTQQAQSLSSFRDKPLVYSCSADGLEGELSMYVGSHTAVLKMSSSTDGQETVDNESITWGNNNQGQVVLYLHNGMPDMYGQTDPGARRIVFNDGVHEMVCSR